MSQVQTERGLSISAHSPLVSVIIPNFNYSQFLKTAIESVLSQTYVNFELIVVDDGSTDDSLQVIRGYGNKLKLLTQKNSGVASARNLGIESARGKFICFLDSDDTWDPHKLQLQVDFLMNSEAGLVYSSILVCDGHLESSSLLAAMYRGDCRHYFYKFPGRSIVLLGCSSAMFRKEVIDSIGQFDTSLSTAADWDFFRRAANHCSFDYINLPLVKYRKHNSNMSSQSLREYYSDNEIAVRRLISDSEHKSLIVIFRLLSTWIKFQTGAASAHFRSKQWGLGLRRLLRSLVFVSLSVSILLNRTQATDSTINISTKN